MQNYYLLQRKWKVRFIYCKYRNVVIPTIAFEYAFDYFSINCEKFSLSTNMISNINNLQAFKSLRILSLGRNIIKSLQGIEGAAETLEQLWISYNQIDRLKPIRSLQKLKVLYMSHNVS